MGIKVSIIIPVYNVEKYIKECLESAINQTLDNYEIIIIDDGSRDSSLNIIENYKKKYNFIRIFKQSNKGAGAARNKGVKEALGEYIYFLDSDDYIDRDTIKKCYDISIKNCLEILTFDAESFYDNYFGSYSDDYNRENKLNSRVYTGEEFFNLSVSKGAYRVSVPIYFYKKSFLLNNNITFIEGMSLEDNLYVFETILKAKNVQYIKNKFYHRRIRVDSVTTGNRDLYEDIELLKFIIRNEFNIYKEFRINSRITKKCIDYVIRDNYYIIFRKIEESNLNKNEKNKLMRDIKILLKPMKSILNTDLNLLIYYPKVYKVFSLVKKFIKTVIGINKKDNRLAY